MKKYLTGFDLSKHQSEETFKKCLETGDFIILKASEGVTYKDITLDNRKAKLIAADKLRGYYHYARPDNKNTPAEEARNFLRCVGDDWKNALCFLDWEGKSLSYDFGWAVQWCEEFRRWTGVNPIIYASASTVKQYGSLYPYWWTAHYNEECREGCKHDGGTIELITQFTSSGGKLDVDIFHGSETDWQALTACGVAVSESNWETVATFEADGYFYEVRRR